MELSVNNRPRNLQDIISVSILGLLHSPPVLHIAGPTSVPRHTRLVPKLGTSHLYAPHSDYN
nr:uncharacterized protein CTRU02_03253 [Colletotrichum truncatum]KAF6797222.1 hypothetical protein CTRU02_03253 [Colletotrichum truncatum]